MPNEPLASRQGGPGNPPEGSRIHVDSDWKKEAQAEKERLAHNAEQAAAAGGPEGAPQEEGPLPPPSFSLLVQQLASQAALFMSREADPETGEILQRLDLAKHTIDLVGVLEEKTRGNLTPQERQLLDTVLYELRMAYVAAAS